MRPATHTILFGLAGFTACSLLSAGCSEKRSDHGAVLASGNAAVAAMGSGSLLGNPLGNMPSQPGAEFIGPSVEITSPARASYHPAGQITLEAKVADSGGGVAEVHVNGMTVQPDAQGVVQTTVTLTPGVNTIKVEAWDNDQKRTERHVSVLAGQFAKETAEVAEAASVRVTDDALNLVEPIFTQGIESQRAAMVRKVLTSPPPKDTKIKSFSFGAVSTDVDAEQGGLRFRVAVDNIALGIEYKAKFLLFFKKTKKGTVRAQRMTIDGVAQVSLVNGKLQAKVANVSAQVTGFSVPSWASKAKGDIQRGFVQAFQASAAQELDKALAQFVGRSPTAGSVSKTALGKTLKLDWRLTTIAFDADGMNLDFAANVRADKPTYGKEDRTFVTGTALPVLQGGTGANWNGALLVHQDALNQALHGIWRTGALSATLDSASLLKLAPLSPVQLDTDSLLALAPELKPFLPSGLPLKLEVESKLPPVVTFDPTGPHMAEISLGSVHTRIIVADPVTNSTTQLAEAIYCLKAKINLIEDKGKIRLDPATTTVEVLVDVTGKALPKSEPLLEKWTQDMAPNLIKAALTNLGGVSVPAVKGYTIQNLAFQAQQNSLAITGNVVKAAKP